MSFTKHGFLAWIAIRKISRIVYKRAMPALHTIKNYVLNKLKRYIKYNYEKLGFLKLRNKFFERLRNQDFRKYSWQKCFQLCRTRLEINIYPPMTKFILLLCRRRKPSWLWLRWRKIFSNTTSTRSRTTKRKSLGLLSRTGVLQQKIRLCLFEIVLGQNTNPKRIAFLVLSFQNHLWRRAGKSCKASLLFKTCFQNCAIGALSQRKKAWSNCTKKQKFIKSSTIFSLQGDNELHMRDTKKCSELLYRRAGRNDFLITFGHNFFFI